jgi:hypothetical protein
VRAGACNKAGHGPDGPYPLGPRLATGQSWQKQLSLRFPLRANRKDGGADLVGVGARTPFGPAPRRPFRFAQGIFEGERPSTLRMGTISVGNPHCRPCGTAVLITIATAKCS